jgi:hypothetical protein
MATAACPLCSFNENVNIVRDALRRTREIHCPVCGSVEITDEAMDMIQYRQIPISAIQGYSRYRTETNLGMITVTIENLDGIVNHPIRPANVRDKLDRLLLSLATKSKFAGQEFLISIVKDYPLAYALHRYEFEWLIKQLIKLKLLDQNQFPNNESHQIAISPSGWDRINELSEKQTDLKQCFVAMSFDKEFDSIYEYGISKAVKECGFKPYRIDREEHTELIPYKMIADIRKSRFVIADFTKQVSGVYFEAGLAIGQNTPVIWICRQDDFENAHFDVKQFNHVIYEKAEDLYEKLKVRIEALIV